MSDIAASERRLSAALDRIDYLLDQPRTAAAAPQPAVDEDGALGATPTRLDEIAQQAARLAAANDELAESNRVLIAAQQGHGDAAEASIRALETEIEALRAARAAEIAQMGDILAELERLLGQEQANAPFAADIPPAQDEQAAEVLSFAGQHDQQIPPRQEES